MAKSFIELFEWAKINWEWLAGVLATMAGLLGGKKYIDKSSEYSVKRFIEMQPELDASQNNRLDKIESTLIKHREAHVELKHGQDMMNVKFDLTIKNLNDHNQMINEALNQILNKLH